MILLALASPVPGALGSWLDARLASGLVFALPLGLAGLAFLRFFLLKRLGNSIPEPRGPFWRGAAAGLAAVAALLAIVLLTPALLGAFRPEASGYAPFSPAPAPASPSSAFATFGFFALQSLVEELLFRAFLLTLLGSAVLLLARLFFGTLPGGDDPLRARRAARRWFVAGLLANTGQSVAFASLHAINPNVTPLALLNIGLAGAVLGWLYWSEGGLLGCWTFHVLWNFTLAAVAVPVSGMSMGTPVLATGIRGAGLPAVSGGAFGPEGSVLCTTGLAAVLVFLVRRSARRLPTAYPSPLMKGGRQLFTCPKCGKCFFYWVQETVPQPKVKCYFCNAETFPNGEPPAAPAPAPPAPKPAAATPPAEGTPPPAN